MKSDYRLRKEAERMLGRDRPTWRFRRVPRRGPDGVVGRRRLAWPWRVLRAAAVIAIVLVAAGAGGFYWLTHSEMADQVDALADYRPSSITRVYASDGTTVIGEFALEKRIPVTAAEIPGRLKQAFLAIEDARFYEHRGIDPVRTLGALYKNLTAGRREGGSTITQQVARNIFLSREQTVSRKLREWGYAVLLERRYPKDKILELYANEIFLGAGSYGVEAGARTYFGKSLKDLGLGEIALLAGLPKAPSQYSPLKDMDAARARRNLVVDQMERRGMISPGEAAAAKASPITLADTARSSLKSSPFDFPLELIRRDVEARFSTRVAQGGLSIYTTLDAAAQEQAVSALRARLRAYDRTHSRWRSAYQNVGLSADGAYAEPPARELAAYHHPDWFGNDFRKGAYKPGLITSINAAKNTATARFGDYTAVVGARQMGWSGRRPAAEFKVGDLPQFLITGVDDGARSLRVELTQVPEVEGSVVTLNARTGEVLALAGGYDFNIRKFNNAVQGARQTGSCFKPILYTAALERGMTPETVISGAEVKVGDWTPHNYDGSKSGPDVPMREALARSLNIQAVRVLEQIGIRSGANMVKRFGLNRPMAPYLPSALGATEASLVEMVSAYSVFPNLGMRAAPHVIRRIEDAEGRLLTQWQPVSYRVTTERIAGAMISMMRDVVTGGTAKEAASLGVEVAGKTGTVNDHTDVWFIGYTPTYVTGVWMGHPGRKRSLGADMTGGRGALPLFVDYMRQFLRGRPRESFRLLYEKPETTVRKGAEEGDAPEADEEPVAGRDPLGAEILATEVRMYPEPGTAADGGGSTSEPLPVNPPATGGDGPKADRDARPRPAPRITPPSPAPPGGDPPPAR